MAYSANSTSNTSIELSPSEVTGALGDSITVLPLLVALAATTSVSLAHVLVGFGIFQIVWGVYYRLPLSVEPMKALVGLAIVGTLTASELVAAGLLAGIVLLAVGRFGVIGYVQQVVGEPVVRGIQFAVALLLLEAALGLSAGNLPVATLGFAILVLFALVGSFRISVLVVLGLGGAVAVAIAGVPDPQLPSATLFPSGWPSMSQAALEGTVAQLGMTIGNAAIATALLCGDLYDRRVSADDLSQSMGVTCLAAIPIGGIPMCHGSGGLAGKHAFGARTAGANVFLGVGYLALALVATGALLVAFPMALLGVLLIVVAFSLARTAFESIATPWALALVLIVGAIGLLVNVGLAFVLGALAFWVSSRTERSGFPSGSPSNVVMTTWAALFDRSELILGDRGPSDEGASDDSVESMAADESDEAGAPENVDVETIRAELTRIRSSAESGDGRSNPGLDESDSTQGTTDRNPNDEGADPDDQREQ